MIVRRIYNLAEQNYSISQIAVLFSKEGVITPSQCRESRSGERCWMKNKNIVLWDRSRVGRILRDEQYTGNIIYGKTKKVFGKNIQVKVPKEDWIIVPNAIPAIISKEQFDRVNKIIQKNTILLSTDKKSLFAGKLKCGKCGFALRNSTLKGQPAHYCRTPNITNELNCMTDRILGTDIYNVVLKYLQNQALLVANTNLVKPIDIYDLKGKVNALQKLIDKL